MKFLAGIVLSIFILFGCGEEKSEKPDITEENLYQIDTADINTSPVDNPDQSFEMRYKLQLNDEYTYRVAMITENRKTMEMDTTITQSFKQTIIYLINIKTVEVEGDSIFDIVCKFNSIKIDAAANEQQYNYQSGVTKDSLDLIRYSDFEALINNPFNLRIDNSGTIVDVYKTDKIISKYLQIQNLADSLSSAETNSLKEQIIQGGIKPIFAQIFRKLPEQAVAKDSIWAITLPNSEFLVFTVSSNNIFKIESLEEYDNDNVAVIDARLDTKYSGSTDVTEQGVAYKFNKPVSEAVGKIFFNIEDGLVLKARIKSKISYSFTMEGNTPQGRQKSLQENFMENTYIIELL